LEQSVDIDNEIAEACLSTFENLIKKSPKEVSGYIQDILQICASLISYDPNYTYTEDNEDQQMDNDEEDGGGWGDFEDDEGGHDDDDDTSWKVRRAAIKTLDAIIPSRPDLLRDIYQKYAKLLVQRFKERDDNVKCNILETF
jgi:cullin-associated NEDD8-dissociated protein 1